MPGTPHQRSTPSATWPRRYGFALLVTAVGFAATVGSVSLMAAPFFMFQFAAVVGAALYGGLGPGLLATALSAVLHRAVFFGSAVESHEAWRLGSFLVVSVFFAWFAAKLRRSREGAERARRRAEAAELEARAVGAQQERLVAVVSHDLRSPLNAITLSAEVLRAAAQGAEPKARAADRILSSARRMEAMIRDLLDYARARHASGLPVHTEPARLGELAHHALEELRVAHPGARIDLEVDGDDQASLDPARIQQVVTNLVSNALQHGSPGAPVRVRVGGDPGAVRLEVSNRGPPIPEELRPALFDPFRAGDAPGSVGLGLFIVREIAHGHGGTVSVRSDERETVFAVTFPRTAPAQAPAMSPGRAG